MHIFMIHNNMIYYSNDFVKKKKINLSDIFTVQGKTIFNF